MASLLYTSWERPLRSKDVQHASIWTTLSPEEAVPSDHPLRPIRITVNRILGDLSPQFAKLYSQRGRPSIPPEKLLRALLLQAFFSIRSEPLLLEQLRYNLLFRWFVGLDMDDPIWDVSTFSKNRERFLDGEISERFFAKVVDVASDAGLVSDEHFTVDGTRPAIRASNPKTTTDRLRKDAIPRLTSRERPCAMPRMNRRPIPRHGCIVRAPTRRRYWGTSRTR